MKNPGWFVATSIDPRIQPNFRESLTTLDRWGPVDGSSPNQPDQMKLLAALAAKRPPKLPLPNIHRQLCSFLRTPPTPRRRERLPSGKWWLPESRQVATELISAHGSTVIESPMARTVSLLFGLANRHSESS